MWTSNLRQVWPCCLITGKSETQMKQQHVDPAHTPLPGCDTSQKKTAQGQWWVESIDDYLTYFCLKVTSALTTEMQLGDNFEWWRYKIRTHALVSSFFKNLPQGQRFWRAVKMYGAKERERNEGFVREWNFYETTFHLYAEKTCFLFFFLKALT